MNTQLSFLNESPQNTKHYKKGEIVVDIGMPISGIPFVKSGLLKVYREDEEDHELFLYYLKPNDVCSMGFKCCLADGKSGARVYAEEDSEVMFIEKEQILNLQSNPEWNNFIVTALTNRIDELLDVADDLAFKNLDKRVLEYLKKKAGLYESDEVSITHREISFDLNSSREVISRVLKKLEKSGQIIQKRNKVILTD